jgi:hypothetical protein
MSLQGHAFIGIWHDLAPGSGPEFERWHTEEHMPERVGVPGFLRGTRYMNWEGGPHVCFTRYELAHIEVFRSPGYLARLNAPTPWSNRVQPEMRNFLRVSCLNVISLGAGTGGAIATLCIRLADASDAAAGRRLSALAIEFRALRGVTSAHLGLHEIGSVDQRTAESALRPAPAAAPFDYVMLIEAIDRKSLEACAQTVERMLADAGAATLEQEHFALAYQLPAPSR